MLALELAFRVYCCAAFARRWQQSLPRGLAASRAEELRHLVKDHKMTSSERVQML